MVTKKKRLQIEYDRIENEIHRLRLQAVSIKKQLAPKPKSKLVKIPKVKNIKPKADGYEVVLWAGETFGDVDFIDTGKSLIRTKTEYHRQIKKFEGLRSISIRKWFTDGTHAEVLHYDHNF